MGNDVKENFCKLYNINNIKNIDFIKLSDIIAKKFGCLHITYFEPTQQYIAMCDENWGSYEYEAQADTYLDSLLLLIIKLDKHIHNDILEVL